MGQSGRTSLSTSISIQIHVSFFRTRSYSIHIVQLKLQSVVVHTPRKECLSQEWVIRGGGESKAADRAETGLTRPLVAKLFNINKIFNRSFF